MKVLVIDIGGTNVKVRMKGEQRFKIPSGPHLTPTRMMRELLRKTADWEYGAVSIGVPGPVVHGRIAGEPPNLARGWVKYDFEKAFKKPVKIMNDAAMQALGSYRGGRMLFIGLGTGLGSALILDNVIVPLELGDLCYHKSIVAKALGRKAVKRNRKAWEKAVHEVVDSLAKAFRTDYIVVGGGNVKLLKWLPKCALKGSNEKTFLGGARLWNGGAIRAKARKHTWVIT